MITNKKSLWENANPLACHHLRCVERDWVALEKDPCPTCENTACHNQGRPFDQPNRLTIVQVK